MKQDLKKVNTEEVDVSKLKEKLEEIRDTPLTRKVMLRLKACCGCGCSEEKIIREVPYDSSLKDGDIVNQLHKSDEWIP